MSINLKGPDMDKITLTIKNCKECPWRKTGTDQRTRVGDRVLVVDKCVKKKGTRIIRNISTIPTWCPFAYEASEASDQKEDRYDVAFYEKTISFLRLGLSYTSKDFFFGDLYKTRGGWVAQIVLAAIDPKLPNENPNENVVALHAVPYYFLKKHKIQSWAFASNNFKGERRIDYVVVNHHGNRALSCYPTTKIPDSMKLFNFKNKC